MKLIRKEPFTVTGIKVSTDWKTLWTEMPKVWKIFYERYQEIPNRKNDRLMDISLEKEGDLYTQCICVETAKNGAAAPEGMSEFDIPEKKFLYHRHVGSVYEIANTFGEMYEWAKDEGLTATDFKIDMGYTENGREEFHELFIEIT